MRVAMAGIDFKTAGVKTREAFSVAAASLPGVLARVLSGPGIAGCVVISTCNRTELYVSYGGDAPPDCPALLCDALGRDRDAGLGLFAERGERRAAKTYGFLR